MTPTELLTADGYGLARELLQRGVAVVYVLAFVAVVHQWGPLLGEHGLTPAASHLRRTSWRTAPSLFRLVPVDRFAMPLGWTGIVLALAVVVGVPQRLGTAWTLTAMLLLWALYLSYVNIGQIWYAFGWESILLEAGSLAAFLGGHDASVPWPTLLLLRWLVFRIEFGAGLIKLRGDPCWRALSCLAYHHETQPLPNPLSPKFHRLPMPLHRLEVAANHVAQLVLPLGLFLPQPAAGLAAVGMIVTQGWLLLSGNFAWLNLITMIVALSAIPDAWLSSVADPLAYAEAVTPGPAWFLWLVVVLFMVQAALSWWPVRNLLSQRQRMNASFNPFHLVGTYGAFGSINRVRHELVIEATADRRPRPDGHWEAYGFRAKPTDPRRRPRQVAPYHLRLDWLLWFAAMSPVMTRRDLWVARLLDRLLEADPRILRLLRHDPLDGRRPTAVRVRRYRYRFSTREEQRQTGVHWVREFVGEYTGIVTRR